MLSKPPMCTGNHRLVPRLRFPEFEGAGEWEEDEFGEVYSFLVTNSFSRDKLNYENGWVKNIHYGDIHTKFSALFDVTKEDVPYINPSVELEKIKSSSYCVEGDMIFADASEDLDDIGKSIEIINLNSEKLLSGLHTLLARQKKQKLIVGFGSHLFKSSSIRIGIKKESQGTKVLGLAAGRLSNTLIYFPIEESEQQKIADCLSTLDEVISAEGEKLDALKAHKKGLMQQLFPAEGKTTPERRFPEFEEAGEWRDSKLSQLLAALNAGVSVNSGDRPARSSEVGILKTSAVTNGIFEPTQNKVVYEENEIQRLKEAVCGDSIIISRMNTPALVGANAYIDSSFDNLFLPDRLWAAKPKPDSSMRFIAFMLGSGKTRAALSELATGTSGSMKNITKPDVLALQIFAPHLPEQQKIANCLTSLDDLITAQSQKIETIKLHKKGMMQQLFPSSEEVSQ